MKHNCKIGPKKRIFRNLKTHNYLSFLLLVRKHTSFEFNQTRLVFTQDLKFTSIIHTKLLGCEHNALNVNRVVQNHLPCLVTLVELW